MAAGLGFKDFTTGEVLTAADVDGYLMQGIWVFDDATARDAAVTSPQEGNSCYLKDTDVIQVYSGSSWVTKSGGSPLTTKGDLYTFSTTDARLAVGANGTTLVADSAEATGLKWATPASGGGMTLLSTTTLSGSQTTISSINQGYVNLFLVGNIISSSDCTINLYYNADTTNANYNVYFTQGYGGTFNHTNRSNGSICETIISSAWNTKNYTQLWIYRYAAAETHYAVSVSRTGFPGTGVDFRDYMARHVHTGTSAITDLIINATAGSLSGTVYLYGVK